MVKTCLGWDPHERPIETKIMQRLGQIHQTSRSLKLVQDSWVAQKPIIDTFLFARKPLGEDGDIKPGKDMFYFDQPVPIQSYLIAIVAGNIKSQQIGPR